jgi:hypothetical protein
LFISYFYFQKMQKVQKTKRYKKVPKIPPCNNRIAWSEVKHMIDETARRYKLSNESVYCLIGHSRQWMSYYRSVGSVKKSVYVQLQKQIATLDRIGVDAMVIRSAIEY